MEEIYRDIPGYEGMYQCSNLGNIKALRREYIAGNGSHHWTEEKIMKQTLNGSGYLQVQLHNNGKIKTYIVHRIIAEVFLPNPDKLPQVNHKSEKKTENFVYVNYDGTVDYGKSNLEWCDNKYNCNYGTFKEKHKQLMLKRWDKKGRKTQEEKDEYTKQYMRQYYIKNREKLLARQREYDKKKKAG